MRLICFQTAFAFRCRACTAPALRPSIAAYYRHVRQHIWPLARQIYLDSHFTNPVLFQIEPPLTTAKAVRLKREHGTKLLLAPQCC
jgi:hypothetical protein